MSNLPETHNRVRVGITHGDVNGISYEIIIKTLLDQRLMENYTITLYGSSKVASYHRKIINANDFNFNLIKKADQAHPRKPNIVNIHDEEVKLEIGKSTPIAGELALLSLEAAIAEFKEGHLRCTCDLSHQQKEHSVNAIPFPGTYRIPGREVQRKGLPDADGKPEIPDRGGHRPYSAQQS